MVEVLSKSDSSDVAIVGIGFRIPSGNLKKSISEPNDLFNNLLNGFNGVVETSERWSNNYSITNDIVCKYAGLLPLDELKQFDPLLFGLAPSEVYTIDPQQRYLLKCTLEAFEDAGIDPSSIRGSNATVFVGACSLDYESLFANPNETAVNIFGSSLHSISNRISYCFDLQGESLTVDSACSSSLNAVNLGYNSIKNNKTTLSICCGSNLILNPSVSKSFSYLNILSPTGKCQCFSAEADGFVRSEGFGVVILKRLDEAIKDGNSIYGIINGSSSNVDGNNEKSTFYQPSKLSQRDNIELAIKSTNGAVSTADIDFFECHGTGTPTGDPIELEGISMVFNKYSKKEPLLIGSLKSNIGHCEPTSGVFSLIKCALMLKYKTFLPNINFRTPNPSIKFKEWNLKVITEPIKFNSDKKTTIAINNFGVTGSNVCVILSEFKQNQIKDNNIKKIKKTQYLIPISSNSSTSLEKYKEQVISKLSDSIDFDDFVNKQINLKIKSFYQRLVIKASNWNEFKDSKYEIKTLNSKKISNVSVNMKEPVKVFVFSGQGSQYNKMVRSLYENEPFFKYSMDRFDNEFSKYFGYSIILKINSIPDDDLFSINQQMIAQPMSIMAQISLFELYKHWGVFPDIVVGHSLGEISSSYCSGMIDFETVCYLTYHRSFEQNKTCGMGRMLSINISAEEYNNIYSSKYQSLEIACYNSPSSIVVVGKESILNELISELKSKDIFYAMLSSLAPFHSSSQLMIKNEILSLNFKSESPKIPIFSTVTSNLFNNTIYDSNYFFDNILQPVKFSETINNIYKYIEEKDLGNDIVFIEISPHPTLQNYLNQMKSQQSSYFNNGENVSIHSPCNKKKNDNEEFLKTISTLYVNHNINVSFKSQVDSIYTHTNKTVFNLPLYQFDDQSYWRNNLSIEKIKKDGPSVDNLGNSIDSPILSYQSYIDIKKKPYSWLKGHTVKGKTYFPGCGYIDNLLKIYPNQDLTINIIEFKTPLILVEGTNQCLQTSIIHIGKNEYTVRSHYKDNKNNQWVLSSVGNFSLFNHGTSNKKVNIMLLKDKCNLSKLTKNEIYEAIRMKINLPYKGLFQGVKESYLGNNCSFSIVSLNQIQELKEFNHLLENKNMSSFFNAAILDTCLHGILGIVQETCQVVLDKVESFKYYSNNIPNEKINEVYVYSEIKPRNDFYSYSASIKVMLEDGTLLIEMFKSKDSLIDRPQSFKYLYDLNEYIPEEYNSLIEDNQLMPLYYKYINQREPKINLESLSTMEYEQFKQLYYKNQINENCFIFIFENLKRYYQIITSNEIISNNKPKFYDLFDKTTRIISKQLIPLDNDDPNTDTPQSLFENNFLDNFYINSNVVKPLNRLLGEIVKQSIKPIVKEPIVFRILEFGGGVGSLSMIVLERIDSLLKEYPNHQIDIEFTWSDISSSFFSEIKEKLSLFSNDISILYNVIDLEKPFNIQQIKSSHYDMIIMSNVLHVVKDIPQTLIHIYDILVPNGQIVYIEPPYKPKSFDSIFMVFPQWFQTFEDGIRKDRCTINQDEWLKVLTSHNFKDTSFSGLNNEKLLYLIQTRKPSINEIINDCQFEYILNYENIILFGSEEDNKSIVSQFNNNSSIKSKISIINNIKDFNILLNENSSIKYQKNLIIFLKSSNILNVNNFKDITYEFIQINQILLTLEKIDNFKLLVLTLNSRSENYLSSSIIGAARYTVEFPQIDVYMIDFDNGTINCNNLLLYIDYILKLNNNQKEIIIRNGKIYFERFKKQKNYKQNLKSKSFENNQDKMFLRLNSNLEYKLKVKKELGPTEIEISVKSSGINFKDYLVYLGVVSHTIDIDHGRVLDPSDNDNLSLGGDISGKVSRVGSDVKKFKIGDEVCGIALYSNGTHAIADEGYVLFKPSNITFTQAAAIPSVYVSSYHSIYYIGNLNTNETILIHSGTGGIGLSSLELLKCENHKGYIFVTVGSKEKEQYLIENYGSFITGIYSSRNKDYVDEIKEKLESLGCENHGVDLIINTLSSEYMDSNFQCLNPSGRICDLSITHLTPFDYMDYNKFKFNYGYHNIELIVISTKIYGSHLNKILEQISTNKLKVLPCVEYSNDRFKEAIEYINERKHIGKIVVNHDKNLLSNAFEDYNNSNDIIMKEKYDVSNLDLGKNILLTGQTGIILEVLKWLIKYSNNSIENIILLSKSPIKWELEFIINQNKYHSKNNINIIYKQIDIEYSDEIENILNDLEINSNIKNIESIIHFAFMNDISKFETVNINNLNLTHGAKTLGAINLHTQSIKRNWTVKQFVMASSAVCILGGDMQCAYMSACTVIDSLSQYRKSIGLPSLSINLGAISSTGFVSRNQSINEMFNSFLVKLISPKFIISSLDLFIQNIDRYSNYCLADIDFENFPTNITNHLLSKFDYQIKKYSKLNKLKGNNCSDGDMKQSIISKISELLSIDETKLNLDFRLIDYGLDSLTIVHIKNWIDKEFGHNLITIQQLQNNKISNSINIIIEESNNHIKYYNKNEDIKSRVNNNNNIEDFIKNEIKIDEPIVSKPYSIERILNNYNSILLTGSTGFLGAYLLYDLITLEQCSKVYCLLRNRSKSISLLDQLLNNLKKHKLFEKLNQTQIEKIIPINAELSKKRLGVSDLDYSDIIENCDIIINSAADISFQSDYQTSKIINVDPIKELIILSTKGKSQKLIIQISSYSVFLNHKLNEVEFDEFKVFPNYDINTIGYIQSKVIGEKLLINMAESKGIPSIIFRLPDIFSNPETGIGHDNDVVSLMLQCSALLKYYPNIYKDNYITPITTLSKNILNLTFSEKTWSNIENNIPISILNLNGEPINMKFLFDCLYNSYPCEEIEYEKWIELIQSSNFEQCKKYNAYHNIKDINYIKSLSFDKGLKMSNRTKQLLKSINSFDEKEWKIDEQMIINLIKYNYSKYK